MNRKLSGLCGLQLLLIAATAWPATTDTSSRYTGKSWAFADTAKIMAAAAEITLAKFPDCDEATVEEKMMRVYHVDGTAEMQDESYVKVLTEKGKRNNRTIKLSFMLPYSTVEVVRLEVRKPDNTVVGVDIAANSKESIDAGQMSMNIYDPNDRVLEVNIPQLEIGDVVHAITRQTVVRSYIPGEFADENVFEGSGYIRHLSYEVQAPAQRPLKSMVLRDSIPGTISYSTRAGDNNTVIHHWEVNNVPRMFPEPAMPSYSMVLQRLLISTTAGWPAVSKWYWELSRQHLDATTAEMKQTVADLTAGAKTDLEKIKAVFYFVSKKIRYMGLTPEKDRPGFEPHDVSITFDKKYGVCRDKAALLVAMLRTAGLKSYPVLINLGSKRDPESADPFFNHAIVCVELTPGNYTLMDPTDEHTRELLPSYDCDQSYLVCRPEGENLKVSPVQPPDDHLMLVKTTGVLSADGRLEAKSELSFEGINDDEYRNYFSHLKPDDIRRFFEGNLKQTLPGARLTSFTLTPQDLLDVSAALHATLEFSVEGMTASGSGKAVVVVPWIGKHLGMVNFILGGAGLEKRKYPMRTYYACGLREEIAVRLADDFTAAVSMPACPAVDDECLSYRRDFGFKNKTLDCSRELKLKVVEFSPAQYLKLKQTLKGLDYDERKSPVMAVANRPAAPQAAQVDTAAKPAVESDAEILESDKTLDVTDAHTAVYKAKYSKRILNYAGKVREAEVKIYYNPATEEARLTHGVVISKAGIRQEISAGETNVMDAGWNASAKRYTGGKILVANLPGVEIGSTIEVEYEIASKGRAYLAGNESFQLSDQLDHKSFRITAPRDIHVLKMVSGAPSAIKEKAGRDDRQQTFQWQAGHVAALPAESQLPPEWVYSAGVDYFVGDLKSYLKNLNDTMLDRSRKRTRTEELVHRLTGQSKTRLEAVKAIRDFVSRSIRMAGPAFTDLPLSELSVADTTLADGYGHAADCAILLHAMLTAAGFAPEFVLTSPLPAIKSLTKVAESFPLPNSFLLPLVKISLDGETLYLNDADQYSRLGSTADDGRLGLSLSTQQYEVIRSARDCADKTETTYEMSMTDSGTTRVNVARRYYGESYAARNRYFSELPPEEKRRYYQELVSAFAQGARPVADLTTRFDTYPGLEQFAVEIDHYSVVDGQYQYFDLPFTPSLLPAGADRRSLPLLISKAGRNVIRTEIELPKGFRHVIISPSNEQLDEPDHGGKARITTSESGGKCTIIEEFESEPAIISPQEYPAMLKIESELGRKSSKAFLLQRN